MVRPRALRGVFLAVMLAAGVGLFVRSVQTLGSDRIAEGLARMGWGFALIVALSGAREVVRTLAWMRSVEGPIRLGFASALRARLAGEALNALLPMGIVVGEPAKAVGVGPQVPLATALAALAVEFAFYTSSLVVIFGAGAVALLEIDPVAVSERSLILAALLPAVAGIVATVRVFRSGAGRAPAASLASDRAPIVSAAARAVAGLTRLESLVLGFARRHPERLLPMALLETAFHALGVVEVWATLWFVSPVRPTIASAVVLETVGRAVTIVFKFLPMRVGVDEAAAAVFSARLRLGTATGITLAIVRKLRILFWSAVGLALMVRMPLALAVPLEWARAPLPTVDRKRAAARTRAENMVAAETIPGGWQSAPR